ncbi:MAG: hypothetical protein E3J86_01730 [Candidatus Thorarchaeota archaeon]|nr:MAG: hypothetical protein E3J86_01730 [Candidatus Thorarchaeota archaeon]
MIPVAKCGDVLLFVGVDPGFLDTLENLYSKPIFETQFGAVHTFGIYITPQKKRVLLIEQYYALIWKPFFGLRWLKFEDVNDGYVRLEDVSDFDRMKTLNVDLGFGELEVKQDHFNKWRGDALTNKLIEYLSRQDVTERFQNLIEEISKGVEEGKYRPKRIFTRIALRQKRPKLD